MPRGAAPIDLKKSAVFFKSDKAEFVQVEGSCSTRRGAGNMLWYSSELEWHNSPVSEYTVAIMPEVPTSRAMTYRIFSSFTPFPFRETRPGNGSPASRAA